MNPMTTLTGTDKQIAWATDLRTTRLDYLDHCLTTLTDGPVTWLADLGLTPEALTALRAELLAIPSAAWWIDRRHYDKVGFLQKIAQIRRGDTWPARLSR